jgi:hypothetical protein
VSYLHLLSVRRLIEANGVSLAWNPNYLGETLISFAIAASHYYHSSCWEAGSCFYEREMSFPISLTLEDYYVCGGAGL